MLGLRCWAAAWAGWPTCGCGRRGCSSWPSGLQLIAFPSPFLPSTLAEGVATALSIGSYVCLVAVFVLNLRLPGMPIAGLGMLLNLAAILANGGHMPALPGAMRDAGLSLQRRPQQQRGGGVAQPGLARRPLGGARLGAVGERLLGRRRADGLGVAVIVAAAMGARLPLRGRSPDAAAAPDEG